MSTNSRAATTAHTYPADSECTADRHSKQPFTNNSTSGAGTNANAANAGGNFHTRADPTVTAAVAASHSPVPKHRSDTSGF